MNFDIEPFLQYGVLGVIGYLFLRMTGKMFETQMKQFELLINNLMQQKTEPMQDVKDSLNIILQAVNNHNVHMSEVYSGLNAKVDEEIKDKKDLLKVFMEMDERNKQSTQEYLNLINAHKMVLFEMKRSCGFTSSKQRVGEILVSKGLITQQQLLEALEEQDNLDMEQMGIRVEEKK